MRTVDEPQPWEQLPAESGPAYRAFIVYRDLGPDRAIDEVARRLGGHQEGTKRAPGRLKKWSSDHAWTSRALAWDTNQARVRQQVIEEAERSSARRWIRRRDELLEKSFETGQRLLIQANLLATFPVLEQTHNADGKVTVVNPVPPTTLRAAAAIAREGTEIAGNAIAQALGLQGEEREQTVALVPRPQGEAQGEATRRVEAHRAAMRARMLTLGSVAPGLSLVGPTPEAGQQTGSGGD